MTTETRIRRNAVQAARQWATVGCTRSKGYLLRRNPEMSADEAAAVILAAEVSRLETELAESNRQARQDVAALALRLAAGIP